MHGPKVLLSCAGGSILLPDAELVLVDRKDGGALIVDPPRPVWERSRLGKAELASWSYLIAATGEAMLTVLPQLQDGCINYWDAGNWALNVAADPPGPKTGPDHRRVHMHLLGRSRFAANPDWAWGEAPRFPAFADRFAWAAGNHNLDAAECAAVVAQAKRLMADKFGMTA